MPSTFRTYRLMRPRGFLSPESSVRSTGRMAPPPMPPPMPIMKRDARVVGPRVGIVVAAIATSTSCWRVPADRYPNPPQLAAHAKIECEWPCDGGPCAASCAAAAECVGLVEEGDDAAVAERELAQTPEEQLHLDHTHADGVELAGVDVDERLAGLARHRFGHERLAGAGRPPQQQAARDVPALLLDHLRVVEEDEVLLHLLEHRVLAPDVGEPRLDVVGVERLDAAPGGENRS